MNSMENILAGDFLAKSKNGIIIDVRTPAEFADGHIPSAINIPIFSNEERVVVGTVYKKQSKEKAVETGLDFVGVKLGGFVRTVKKLMRKRELDFDTPIYVYCWRGGMRSNSMAWLFRTAGFNVDVLKGGYKAYRASFIENVVAKQWKLIVLGGPTGCGKTYILNSLREQGEQVIDLEGLASHRGSAFGNYGHDTPQPTSEQFANCLYEELRELDSSKYIWCEGESMSIGRVFMPQEFYNLIQSSELIHFDMPVDVRLDHIMKDYGDCPKEVLTACFANITKRLGNDNAKKAIELIADNQIKEAAAIALGYYDKSYLHSLENRINKIKHRVFVEEDNPDQTAKILIEKSKEILC